MYIHYVPLLTTDIRRRVTEADGDLEFAVVDQGDPPATVDVGVGFGHPWGDDAVLEADVEENALEDAVFGELGFGDVRVDVCVLLADAGDLGREPNWFLFASSRFKRSC